ncbi:MAG: S8 family serine peptidase [Fidelibacterota bacterium]
MKRILFAFFVVVGSLAAREILPDNVVAGEVVFKLAPETALIRARTTVTGLPAVDRELARFEVRSVEPMLRTRARGGENLPDINRIYVARFDAEIHPRVVAKALENQPGVIYAEPRFVRQVYDVPNDPKFADQWHLEKILADTAWGLSHGDSTVIVAVVDNGFDMDHPDLESNYYTNPGETAGNGVDDDGNGYVDDVHGWDFAGNDNDPNHGPEDNSGLWVHGTHVSGLANAVTDNNEGVAGVAWNVRTLPVKASYDDDPLSVNFGYDGIVYAADMGAHIINCSWGGGGFSQAEADFIEYANGMGSLVVGAAGNAASAVHHFPSGYEGVLSVAATSKSDARAWFSSFGLSVDVSAPGEGVLATFPEGNYGSISGTSMSAPVTAGLLGLVKSHPSYRDLTAKELALRVAGTADNIDGANPDYVGMLGSGRINALQALNFTEQEFADIPPRIELWGWSATDSLGGDGNGLFDRGETIHISTAYWNHSLGEAAEYSVNLGVDDPDLTVIEGSTEPATFPADTTTTQSHGLSFSVSSNATPHMADVALNLRVDGELHVSDTLTFIIGKMPILVVSDGGNAAGGASLVEGFYTGILDEMNLLYGVWDHASQGTPSGDVLARFPSVVWFTEWYFPTLDEKDRSALKSYLEGGGNLFVSGQDLGWDLADPAQGFPNQYNLSDGKSKDFFEAYLHAIWGGDDAGTMGAVGIYGDPIGHNLEFDVYQPGIPSNFQFPDWFTPDADADLVFEYDNGKGMGLRYDGSYRLVYTGVGLEAFGSQLESAPPDDINDVQRTVLARILHYLNFIRHDPLADTESTVSDFDVSVQIKGDTSDLETVTLFWKTDASVDFDSALMVNSGGGRFTGTIPAPNTATGIEYYVEAVNDYYRWTNPAGAPANIYRFFAGPDTVRPEVVFVSQLEDRIDRSGTEDVSTFVADNIGVGDVFLEYTFSPVAADTHSALMTLEDGLWGASLQWTDLPGNTVITYWIRVVDASSNQNEAVSDPLSFQIINWTKIGRWEEEDVVGWHPGDGWGLYYFNPTIGFVMDDSPGENYENNAENILTRVQAIDVSPYTSAYLVFRHLYFLEEDRDSGYVEISTDLSGGEWTVATTVTGQGVTQREVIDLTSLIPSGEVWLRFRLTSDEQNTMAGWYVDDILLTVDTSFVATAEEPVLFPEAFSLDQNYPNPFNARTIIPFSLPHTAAVTLTVYDLMGREVARPLDGQLEAGRHEVIFEGINLASGVYVYRLKADETVKARKFVILK